MLEASRNSSSSSLTLTQAARLIAQSYPECHRCDPSSCLEAQRYYWRLDEAFRGNSLYQARTPLLPIPMRHRLPYLTADNFSDHLKRINPNLYEAPLLWDFNPSIAILPKDQIPNESKLDRSQTYYIMAVRVSSHPNCFPDKAWNVFNQPWKRDLLGLAILDHNLHILLNTVVDHGNQEDQRIFNLKGQLYLGFGDSFRTLWINPPQNAPDLHMLRPLFPSNNNNDGFDTYIDLTIHCCSSRQCQGKNFNYFVDDQGTVLVEMFQSNPRIVEAVDTTNFCDRSDLQFRMRRNRNSENQFLDKYYSMSQNNENFTIYITEDLPRESFGTMDEIHFADNHVFDPPYTEERGTACCIRINDPRKPGKELFVGISHSKTEEAVSMIMLSEHPGLDFGLSQYTSRLYAFETTPPFQLVARSGQFCLESPQDAEEQKEYYNRFWIEQVPYRLNHSNHSCPRVSYISALSESVDDPSQAIIGYGLTDCAMRIAKVRKDHLVHLLFLDQQNNSIL